VARLALTRNLRPVSWEARSGAALLRISQAFTGARLRVTGSAGRPPAIDAGPYLTLVARLPEEAVADVCRQAREALADVPAHVYTPHTVHLTIVAFGDCDPYAVERAVRDWTKGQPPLRVRIASIGYTNASAYLMLDGGPELREARRALARAAGLRRAGAAGLRRLVTVANFARFRGPLSREAAARLAAIRVPAIEFELSELELVRTDKLLSDVGTTRIAELTLDYG
jgi:2'-5' RNA ligase